MAHILVRDVDPRVVERLKASAKQHGRSLQGEVRIILGEAVTWSMAEARRLSEQWHKRLAGRMSSESAKLIREDRRR